MQKRSLVEAKAHFSEIVDAAEHRGARFLILRHGKPAAAIVPFADVVPDKPKRGGVRRPSKKAVEALFAHLGKGNPEVSAVVDLIRNRR
jgi:prevent-host-death family protein